MWVSAILGESPQCTMGRGHQCRPIWLMLLEYQGEALGISMKDLEAVPGKTVCNNRVQTLAVKYIVSYSLYTSCLCNTYMYDL